MICKHPVWEEYYKHPTKNVMLKRKEYPKAKGRIKTEIAIIGGGITGLSNAYFLSKAGHTVTLLESHKLASGSTGASAGIFDLGHETEIVKVSGQPESEKGHQVRRLWELSLYSIKLLEELIQNECIDCDYQKIGSINLAAKKSHVRMLEQENLARKKMGFFSEFLDEGMLREEIGTTNYHAGLFSPYNRAVNPLKLIDGMAAACVKGKVDIFEHSAVKQIYSVENKVFLATEYANIEAEKVIVATDSFTYDLGLRHDIIPMTSFAAATEPLSANLMDIVFKRRKLLLWDSFDFYDYFRPTADNRLVIGTSEISVESPVRHHEHFMHDQPLIDIRATINRVFPELKNIRLTNYWRATFGYTRNMLPIMGPDRQQPNIIYSVAYSGHGLNFGLLSGKIISDYLEHGDAGIFEVFGEHGQGSRSFMPIKIRHKMMNSYLQFRKFLERI